jgi:hypothetical protein
MIKIKDANGMDRLALKVTPDKTYPGFIKVQFRRHFEWISITEFVKFNPHLTDLIKDAPKVADDVVGVVTSSGPDYLRDTSQNWKPNAYLGMFAWISRGLGEGQKRTVVKNSKNQLLIDKPWDTKPNKTSQYVISYNVQEVRAMGNSLPAENIKELEKKAIIMDRQRGRLNKQFKYLKPEEVD